MTGSFGNKDNSDMRKICRYKCQGIQFCKRKTCVKLKTKFLERQTEIRVTWDTNCAFLNFITPAFSELVIVLESNSVIPARHCGVLCQTGKSGPTGNSQNITSKSSINLNKVFSYLLSIVGFTSKIRIFRKNSKIFKSTVFNGSSNDSCILFL